MGNTRCIRGGRIVANAPIKESPLDESGFFKRAWVAFFTTQTKEIADNTTAIDLNTIHRTSDGSDHTFIDQDVTISSSPTFAGLTVDGKDMIKWAVLQG